MKTLTLTGSAKERMCELYSHISDDLVERYLMGLLTDPEGRSVEEHLLVCVGV
jgi:hypothetical protein